jgi:VWFA-related protein
MNNNISTEGEKPMGRLLKAFLVLALLVTNTAWAQIVIGPEDDQTVIDTTIPPGPIPRIPISLLNLDFSTQVVNTVNISQIDCSRFPLICMYVDILDASGYPIGGLTSDSFCVSQDTSSIGNFTVQQLSRDSCITSVCMVVDVSGSMAENHKLDSAKAALHRFVNNMDPYDRVAIVPYSNCIGTITPFTSNKTTLNNAINALTANGNTACYDGIYKGVDLTRLELGSKAVIAFTDGLENRSRNCYPPPDGVDDHSYADDSTLICNLATAAGIPIYTFNLGPIDNTWYNPEALQAFSGGTGGTWTHAPTSSDIDSLYSKIKQKLCSRYYICYTSLDTVQNGDIHSTIVCHKDGALCTPCDTASCQEKAAPAITRTPATIALENNCQSDNNDINICAYVTDEDTPSSGLTVTLFYRVTGQTSYTSIAMSAPSGDSTFCVTVASTALTCKTNLDYYITASDGEATVSDPIVNPQVSPHTISICPNNPPVANAGSDQTISQCSIAQICWAASCSDIDGNLMSQELISTPGTYNGNQICFTPTGTLNYEFVLKATDSCGAVDYDTVVIYYSLNSAPTANAGRDSTLFQCTAAPICWAASCSDVDGNLSSCTLVSSPGTYNGSQICFTPSASGSYTFILEATDACGLKKRDTAVITVSMNTAPICSVPNDTSFFQCSPTQVCLPVSATDANGNLKLCQIIDGPGSLSGGNWCYTPSGDQAVTVTIRCEDSCGAYCEESFNVAFDVNQAPTIAFGNDTTIFLCSSQSLCFSYIVSDPENGVIQEELVFGSGSIDTLLNEVCFTPSTAGTYTFIVKATDSCGLFDKDTINVTINMNHSPVANAGSDQTIFQCSTTQICWAAGATDPDNNLSSVSLVSSPGTYSGGNICFTPTGSGSYTFILEATDACGLKDRDTAVVTVTLNTAPVCQMPPDTNSFFQCNPTQVSLAVGATDADNNFSYCEITDGPGSLVGGNWVYTPSGNEFRKVIIRCLDACGAYCVDSFFVRFTINTAPVANAGSDQTIFQCSAAQICWAASCNDVDGNLSNCALVSSVGTYSGGNICFTPTASGSYTFILEATDACGATDRDTAVINVTINQPPVANAGLDQTIFQCSATQICWAAGATDPDNNLSSVSLVSSPGTYSGGNICFTPTGSGSYTFILEAIDICGARGRDTSVINITLNGAPSIAFGNDTSLFLCQPQQVCLDYDVSDPQGLNKLVETMISGYGTIDTAADKICFTPTSPGQYRFIAGITDSCGVSDADTIIANITFGEFAVIDCPTSPISVSLCDPGTVCQTINITPSSATVGVSYGTYSGGQLCFDADTSGTYIITIIATASCNADTCEVTFNVDIGEAAQLSCPGLQTRFICQPGQVCVPVGVVGAGATVNVTPIGSYGAGEVCFPADTSGHYVLTVIASTTCGSDTCIITANITINSNPIAVNPSSPVDTFLCIAAQICRQFSASDINGGSLVWNKLSGDGALNASGQWCFTPSAARAYSISAAVADSCGAADTVSLTYNVSLNGAPTIAFGNDTTIFLCSSGSLCFPYGINDPDGNAALEELLYGTATIDTAQNRICFTPSSSGSYTFIARVTDGCGLTDVDTIVINTALNSAPVANAGSDQTIFQCTAAQICWAASCSDVDGNLSSCALVSSPGTYNGSQICFTPSASGSYTFILEATDVCGLKKRDTAVITVNMNAAPVCSVPNDTSIFQCLPTQICLPVSATDVNGNLKLCQIIDGPGTLSGGNWCYTPSGDQASTVTIRCEDSCGAYCEKSFNISININQAPTIAFGNDTTIFLCSSGSLCFPYTVTDPENNIVQEELVAGLGGIDTLLNKVCFTPSAVGIYTFIIKATDGCGLIDADTINVTVNMNHAPVANAGSDQTIFRCSAAQICWAAGATDPDNNLSSVALISSPGTYSGGNICFTPTASGSYTFILEATDVCGLTDRDTAVVTVTLNTAPVCQMPPDTNSFFQCSPTQVSLSVGATDANGNFSHCEITNGPGSLVGGNWVYTPSGDEFRKIVIKCLDSCGAYCVDSFFVRFTINTAPVANAGSDQTIFQCSAAQICWAAGATDVNGNLSSVTCVSGLGTYSGGNICFTPPADGSYTFVLEATDACGAKDRDTVSINVNFNHPPVITAPPNYTLFFDYADEFCFDIDIDDADNNLSTVTVLPNGTYNSSTGKICIALDTTGTYCMIIRATDSCGSSVSDTVCINVQLDECIHVQIEKAHNVLQGHHQMVNVLLNGTGKAIGGFDFLIAYDNSALSFISAVSGSLLDECEWEYFTYRYGYNGNCSGCPSGIVHIVAIAESNNGAYHPECYLKGQSGTLATIDFLVSNDRTLECQFVPIQFIWVDCGDNAISSPDGDTLWVSRNVYNFEGGLITDYNSPFPTYYGVPDNCLVGGGAGKPAPIRCIDFINGGIDIVCADSIDARGDINLNSVPNEIGDAIVFTNYFIYGLQAFTVNVEGQTAATEVNGDGITLSVADLVYLIRIISGDAVALSKLNPNASARFYTHNNCIEVETSIPIGAVAIVFGGDADPALGDGAVGMEMKSDYHDGMTHVLIYSMDKGHTISSGNILKINGRAKLISIEASDYYGAVLKVEQEKIPVEFSLKQNYPNPFNPTTIIEFALPKAGEYELDIFNILGQKVASWHKYGDVGYQKIEWDATEFSSGVYFYRLKAGEFSNTKKMLILK